MGAVHRLNGRQAFATSTRCTNDRNVVVSEQSGLAALLWILERPVLPIELEKADVPVFVAPRCQPKNVKAQLSDMLGMKTRYSV